MFGEIKLKLNIIIITLLILIGCENNYSVYDKFNDPSINNYSDEMMLVFEIKGDPNETAEIAFSILYKAFYSLKREYGLENNPPLARWITSIELPRDQWIGQYAIKLNQKVKSLPDEFYLKYKGIKLLQWEYENVAEILHRGDYSQINNTVKLLKNYISDKGYIHLGDHEEIYIKGPGMFLKGNSKKYITLIRYPVEKLQ